MRDTVDLKITKLKKRKEKLHVQQALSFFKEAQEIFQEDFTPSLVLDILKKSRPESDPCPKASWHLMRWREQRRYCCCYGVTREGRHWYN